MSYIKVNPSKLSEYETRIATLLVRIKTVQTSFYLQGSSLDWNVKSKMDIMYSIKQINQEMEKEVEALRRMQVFLMRTIADYKKLYIRSSDVEKSGFVKPQTARNIEKKEKTIWNKMFKAVGKEAGLAGSIFGTVITWGDFAGKVTEINNKMKNKEVISAEDIVSAGTGLTGAFIKSAKLYHTVGKKGKKIFVHATEGAIDYTKTVKNFMGLNDYYFNKEQIEAIRNVGNNSTKIITKEISGKMVGEAVEVTSKGAITPIFQESFRASLKKEFSNVSKTGVVLSALSRVSNNVAEAGSGEISWARAGLEQVLETAIEVGKDCVLTAVVGGTLTGAAAVAGMAAPATIVVMGTAAVTSIGLDWIVESLTGGEQDFAEWTSDVILDFGEGVVEWYGEQAANVGKVMCNAYKTAAEVGNKIGTAVKNVYDETANMVTENIETWIGNTKQCFGNTVNNMFRFAGIA